MRKRLWNLFSTSPTRELYGRGRSASAQPGGLVLGQGSALCSGSGIPGLGSPAGGVPGLCYSGGISPFRTHCSFLLTCGPHNQRDF